jgi:hypothetical protein
MAPPQASRLRKITSYRAELGVGGATGERKRQFNSYSPALWIVVCCSLLVPVPVVSWGKTSPCL